MSDSSQLTRKRVIAPWCDLTSVNSPVRFKFKIHDTHTHTYIYYPTAHHDNT